MRQYIFISMLLLCSVAKAQDRASVRGSISLTDQAKMHIDPKHVYFNPAKGFDLYKQAAEQGDAKAMNALAILYSEGIGTEQNQEDAFKWFKQAAEKGYAKAWYNLGRMYQKGNGVTQNFKLAYESFSKGSALNATASIYAQSYMLYKGLGCVQNYEEAVALFKKGSRLGSLGSMYFLGLSYRNGYGTAVNIDSARYWLNKAASAGYQFAIEELEAKEPENVEVIAASNLSGLTQAKTNAKISVPSKYQKVKHSVQNGNLDGIYKGYAIKYDWSGKHIISKSALTLELKQNGKELNGTWTEDGVNANVLASFTDSSIVFKNTTYRHTDHYSPNKAVQFEFRDASLQVVQLTDSVYLTGNLRLWATERKEPERPMYITLKRDQIINKSLVVGNSAELQGFINDNNQFLVYPNPFTKSVELNFSLPESSKVSITLLEMGGKVVYSKALQLERGKHAHSIVADIPAGFYILKLGYGMNSNTTILIKQ